jgi:hypothetical protein
VGTRIWTAAELEEMTPEERRKIFEASVVTDLAQAPAELLRRTRSRVERLIEAAEGTQPA